ncbi:sigma-54 dependent transcriptional regulator [Pararobbsia silviterrae]|uniref:Sigma-54-dependent Fis family transcriptional regulator n=1 Tax=Pararobbsia silviterrae TaxID=1792498 RepID=A0A494Y9Y7_9BURK|nr:sigma-54 dependent transcriptional regulator [Pararobbsia silviterrae]RKP59186.1 sigma-54-dependent Fis family transcriptional regulator [Pararobbsia silviterrae]
MDTGQRRQLVYVSRQPNEQLHDLLRARGWDIKFATTAREVQRAIQQDGPTGGLFDVSSGYGTHELGAFESCLTLPNVGWVATAGSGQLADRLVRRLIRDYCFDYLTVPYSGEKIVDSIGHAYGMVALGEQEFSLAGASRDEEMVGSCDAMRQLFRTIRKVANTDASVFIAGESGTGKELTARAIHERSERRKMPFIAINCGAIPHHLLQSELFGYERGAFTGANTRKIGRVEAANGGTLFLDEVGDLPLESQASLLRFLQERKIERLGGQESIPVDVRVIAATHVDLEQAMRENRFRVDLFHRLCVLRVDEPPLRARGKDIELLAHHMLERFRTDNARRLRGFSAPAIEAMYNYGWPGNVRELINRVRRAIVMAEGRLITPEDLELQSFASQRTVTLAEAREEAERHAIEAALLRHRHRLNEAAVELGISRVTLYRLMVAHGLRSPSEDRLPIERVAQG